MLYLPVFRFIQIFQLSVRCDVSLCIACSRHMAVTRQCRGHSTRLSSSLYMCIILVLFHLYFKLISQSIEHFMLQSYVIWHLGLLICLLLFEQAHIEQCVYRLRRCKYCQDEVPFINLQVDKNVCYCVSLWC